ncbi:Calmodulin-dependent protein kinase cmk2 [Sorochytrium milnesiophthora]
MLWRTLFACTQPPSYRRRRLYKFGNVIGSGTYGIVREAVDKATRTRFAVKVISKDLLPTNSTLLRRELQSLDIIAGFSPPHPHLVGLHDHFESRSKHYLVFDLALGGELFDRILERGRFTERDAARLVRCLVNAVCALHDAGIVHRDLKPENLLFRNRDNLWDVVVADFGVSRVIDKDAALMTVCGSPGYCAPEILLEHGHNRPCDMWSVGVISFTILCGYSPFGAVDDPQTVIENMMEGKVDFDERYWQNISTEAKDFISCLLQLDPAKRFTAQQALDHPWLASVRYPLDQYGEPHPCQPAAGLLHSYQHNDVNLLSENVLTNLHTIRGTRANRMASDVIGWLRRWQGDHRARSCALPHRDSGLPVSECASDAASNTAAALKASTIALSSSAAESRVRKSRRPALHARESWSTLDRSVDDSTALDLFVGTAESIELSPRRHSVMSDRSRVTAAKSPRASRVGTLDEPTVQLPPIDDSASGFSYVDSPVSPSSHTSRRDRADASLSVFLPAAPSTPPPAALTQSRLSGGAFPSGRSRANRLRYQSYGTGSYSVPDTLQRFSRLSGGGHDGDQLPNRSSSDGYTRGPRRSVAQRDPLTTSPSAGAPQYIFSAPSSPITPHFPFNSPYSSVLYDSDTDPAAPPLELDPRVEQVLQNLFGRSRASVLSSKAARKSLDRQIFGDEYVDQCKRKREETASLSIASSSVPTSPVPMSPSPSFALSPPTVLEAAEEDSLPR